jgi:hypothetical protein
MRRPRALLLSLLAASLAAPALAAGSAGEIAQETLRSEPRAGRVLQAWWLPPEYWEAAAERQSWPKKRRQDLRERIRSYLVIAFIEANLARTKLEFAEHREIAERISVERSGTPIEPLRRLDPTLAEMIPELSYFLRVSLGALQDGVRLLFFPNVTESGEPILNGSRHGALRVVYRLDGEPEPVRFEWRAPLTSVVGAATCPEGGEALQASWRFCPWHGVEVKPRPAP